MDKLFNLYRLNFKNQIIVLKYLIFRILRMPNNLSSNGVYLYYNYLIKLDGIYITETKNAFVTSFKEIFNKNVYLRKKPSSDMAVLDQVILHKEYLPVVTLFKSNFPECSNVNIIDAGSNIGLTAMFFKIYFPQSSIYCIEPDKENFKLLSLNLSNKVYNDIHKINGALWNENTKVEIVKDFRDQLDWSFRVEASKKNDALQAYSLNEIVKKYNIEIIDILKIDVEGAEKMIFTAKNSNLNFLNKTRLIAIEIHKEFNCEKEILHILREYGFKIQKSGELTIGHNKNLL